MSSFRLDGSGWSRRLSGEPQETITFNAETREVIRASDGAVIGSDIFEVLTELTRADPTATWIGYLGYACRPDLPARPASGVPDAVWMRVPAHVGDAGYAGALPLGKSPSPLRGIASRKDPHTPRLMSSIPDSYTEAFGEVQRRLRAGDSYEVNLTRRVDLGIDIESDPDEVYAELCAINPAPYAAHLWHDGTYILSASPECFVTIADGHVRTKPIKGTTSRGADEAADRASAERLETDPRFRAENLMITDLMRNDLSQVCSPGTVKVSQLMQVESYASVHQLVSTVEGTLRPETGVIAAVRALFPAGSMTGAPKRRTMEIIDAVEGTPRGIYSGVLGWIRGDACELSVVIRTLVRDPGGHWSAGTGGGVTVHTDAASEWTESEWKVDRLRSALERSRR